MKIKETNLKLGFFSNEKLMKKINETEKNARKNTVILFIYLFVKLIIE